MQQTDRPVVVQRADYQPPEFFIDTVDLHFDLADDCTRVHSELAVRRNQLSPVATRVLQLNGEQLRLIQLSLDGRVLQQTQDYELTSGGLKIFDMPDNCSVEVTVEIDPAANTALEGLYLSSGNFCTQCEAEGFRRITYFPDRPDVLSRFSVEMVADKARYPVLLANGNLVDSGEAADGRHWARWLDPHPKPCYLFALVAGDLVFLRDEFTTASGRAVELRIYVESHNLGKCDYAMVSLKKAMLWDEKNYNLEYDLDVFMIVAVDDFNMGAMENKGLNIFNSKYVLADQATATDTDFQGIESVVAHEYFHNWTGNRVTCRDWFQLSLKEGLTVFRDQQFTASLNSAAVKRISDVRFLREHQFDEDASPMAHPVRPDSYIEINNFYTVTIYEKGAEIIRMLHTLLGDKKYTAGIALYFERHDGQAVSCDDFLTAMEDASAVSMDQFRLWYSQAGTPVLKLQTHYDSNTRTFSIQAVQSCAATPGQPDKQPLLIPLNVALFDTDGTQLALRLVGEPPESGCLERTLTVTDKTTQFTFCAVESEPVLSALREFSAPVILDHSIDLDALGVLMQHDTDSFNRWEAAQKFASLQIERGAERLNRGEAVHVDNRLLQGLSSVLADDKLDEALRALTLRLPEISTVSASHAIVDIDNLGVSTDCLQRSIAQHLATEFEKIHQHYGNQNQPFSLSAKAMGQRDLRNLALEYLVVSDISTWGEVAMSQFEQAGNMTDRVAALTLLLNADSPLAAAATEQFYTDWKSDRLVLDKWFSMQARARHPQVLDRVEQLTGHPDFDMANPNRARSLISAFAAGNPRAFHQRDGRGYQFLARHVAMMDSINPQIAARLCSPLTRWQRYDFDRQQLMTQALRQLLETTGLSADLYEIASKGLAA